MCKACDKAYAAGRPANCASDPKCGFKNGRFSRDNWKCETLLGLRRIAHDRELAVFNEDSWIATFLDPEGGWLVLTWYKDRGRTEAGWRIESGRICPLTEKCAERVHDYYKKASRG